MENKVVEAVRESVEAMRRSLLEELREMRARVDQVEERVGCVVLAAVAATADSSRLQYQEATDENNDVRFNAELYIIPEN